MDIANAGHPSRRLSLTITTRRCQGEPCRAGARGRDSARESAGKPQRSRDRGLPNTPIFVTVFEPISRTASGQRDNGILVDDDGRGVIASAPRGARSQPLAARPRVGIALDAPGSWAGESWVARRARCADYDVV